MKKNSNFVPLALYTQSKQTPEISINNTLNMLNNRVSDILATDIDTDAATLFHIEEILQQILKGRFLPLTGNLSSEPVTGDLVFDGNTTISAISLPVNDTDAVPLQSLSLSTKNFLSISGTSSSTPFTGNINFNNIALVTGLANPINDSDAVNLQTMQSHFSDFLSLSGSILSGTLDMNNYSLTGLANPVQPYSATNLSTFDSLFQTAASHFVPITGTSATQPITGNVTLQNVTVTGLGTAVSDSDAVNLSLLTDTLNTYLLKSGSNLEGDLNLNNHSLNTLAAPVQDGDLVNKIFLDTYGESFVKLSGDTLTGSITMSTHIISNLLDPVASTDAVNLRTLQSNTFSFEKIYIPFSGNSSTDPITKNLVLISKYTATGLENPSENTDIVNLQTLNTKFKNSFPIKGGPLFGNINANNFSFSNLTDPIHPEDALNLETLTRLINETISLYIPLSGTTSSQFITGNIVLNSEIISLLPQAKNPEDIVTSQDIIDTFSKKLILSGGALSGNLNMSLQKIITLANPVNPTDAVNLQTVSSHLTPFLPLSGGSINYQLNVGNTIVSEITHPIKELDAVNLQTLQSLLKTTTNNFIPLSGNTTTTPITGNIVFDSLHLVTGLATPVNDADAVNLDTLTVTAKNYLLLKGGNLSGNIDMNSLYSVIDIPNITDATDVSQAVNRTNLSERIAIYFPLSGSSLSGPLNMQGHIISDLADPINPTDAVTLGYLNSHLQTQIDQLIPLSGNTTTTPITGNIVFDSLHLVTGLANPVNDSDAVNLTTLSEEFAAYMPLSGSALQGTLFMGSQKIVNLANPVNNTDAVTLSYVQPLILNTLKKKILLSGTELNSPITGNIDAGSNFTLTNLSEATENSQPITFGQLKTKSALYLPLAGGTLSGTLNMSGFKITGLKLATTNFQLVSLTNLTESLVNYIKDYLPLSGTSSTSVLQGNITFNGTNLPTGLPVPQSNSDVANLGSLTSRSQEYFPLTGSSLTGSLSVPELSDLPNASSDTSAAPFKQAATFLNSKILPISGNTNTSPLTYDFIFDNSHLITGLAAPLASTDAVNLNTLQTTFSLYLPLSGSTMTGSLDINNQSITNLAPNTQKSMTNAVTLDDINIFTSFPLLIEKATNSNSNSPWKGTTPGSWVWGGGSSSTSNANNFYSIDTLILNNSNYYNSRLSIFTPGLYLFSLSLTLSQFPDAAGGASGAPFQLYIHSDASQDIPILNMKIPQLSGYSSSTSFYISKDLQNPCLLLFNMNPTNLAAIELLCLSFSLFKIMD